MSGDPRDREGGDRTSNGVANRPVRSSWEPRNHASMSSPCRRGTQEEALTAMSNQKAVRSPQGIRARHSRSCRSREGKRCDCRPSWEAWAYSKRDDKKIRRTFPTHDAAKAWRADALNALNRGRLRAPTPTTLNQAAAEFLAGARDGSIPNRSGHTYKPAALRGYERSLRERILPALGPIDSPPSRARTSRISLTA
jgi:hypothetical protein